MKSFVVIGVGRFGENLARTLHSLGHEVLAIDEKEERIQRIADHVTHAVAGNIKDEHVLRSLGVRNFDCAVVALSEDMGTSVLVTLMLKELGVKFVVTRATSELHKRVLERMGADKVVFPEKDMGMKLAQSLAIVNILDYIELSDEYSIVETKVPVTWVGKTLRSLNVRAQYGVNIVAVKNSNSVIDVSPNPDQKLKEGDVLVIIGSNDDIGNLT